MINPKVYIYLRPIMISVVIINTLALLMMNQGYKSDIKELKKDFKKDIRKIHWNTSYVEDNQSKIRDLEKKNKLLEFDVWLLKKNWEANK